MRESRIVSHMDGTDIKRIRDSLEMSQAEFALLLRVSVRTLQNWEQNRNTPSASGVALLQLAEAGRLRKKK